MTFAWPHLFWLLLVPIALLAADIARRRRAAAAVHPKIVRAEAGTGGLTFVRRPKTPHRTRPWLCAGLILIVVALTRPQWGRIEEPVFDQAREILIAIDLSRSMLAQDVKPSRLERAKLLTQSLLEKLEGERVGLVTFSGTALLQSPLSSDYEILREFLPALNPEFLPEGGTDYSALIETALAGFGSTAAADRFLIILSDGEATDETWKAQAAGLKKKGIRVIGLGVGTQAGAMIPDPSGGFVKDDRGAVVLSRLESGTLQQLSEETGGVYRDASGWVDLASVLRTTIDAGQKGKFVDKKTVRQVERYQWPLAFGVWCLLFSFLFEFPVRPRPRELRMKSRPPFPTPPSTKVASAAGLVLLLAAVPLAPRADAETSAAKTPQMLPLAKIVGRLSSQPTRSARDWAELARETLSWGHGLQAQSRPIPPGPVRDALAAVDLGAPLDPKTADWSKLRTDLEQLLHPPESQKNQQKQDKQDEPKNDSKDQQQQQQDQSQQNQDSNPKNQDQKQDSQSPSKPEQQNQPSKPQDSGKSEQKDSGNSSANPEPPRNQESAFGDMKERSQPPPSQGMQKVGGAPEKPADAKIPADPQLALPLQKLDQVRNQDSPAELYRRMDLDKKPTPQKKGKNW